jgi:flagellar biosynthesis protein FliQ
MAEAMLKDQIPALVQNLEGKRAFARKKYVTLMAIGVPCLIVAILFGALMVILNWTNGNGALLFIPVILGIGGVICIVVGSYYRHNYSSNAYTLLVNTVDQTLFPKALKDPNRGMILSVLLKPGFFASPDRYYGKNYKTATYDGISFEQAGYDLQRRESHTDSKGNTYYTYETYAKGTMYRFAYDRNFAAIVKVLEKSGILSFGSGGLKKVETEYIAFNKKFQVLTSDETLVFYLLTPQIQEKILDLEGKFKGKFYMAFIGDELFIAVNDSDTSIEIPFKQPITVETLTPVIECLAIPAVFITLLGLNKSKFQKDAGTMVQG